MWHTAKETAKYYHQSEHSVDPPPIGASYPQTVYPWYSTLTQARLLTNRFEDPLHSKSRLLCVADRLCYVLQSSLPIPVRCRETNASSPMIGSLQPQLICLRVFKCLNNTDGNIKLHGFTCVRDTTGMF